MPSRFWEIYLKALAFIAGLGLSGTLLWLSAEVLGYWIIVIYVIAATTFCAYEVSKELDRDETRGGPR